MTKAIPHERVLISNLAGKDMQKYGRNSFEYSFQ